MTLGLGLAPRPETGGSLLILLSKPAATVAGLIGVPDLSIGASSKSTSQSDRRSFERSYLPEVSEEAKLAVDDTDFASCQSSTSLSSLAGDNASSD